MILLALAPAHSHCRYVWKLHRAAMSWLVASVWQCNHCLATLYVITSLHRVSEQASMG
jgi:hypothetical protein